MCDMIEFYLKVYLINDLKIWNFCITYKCVIEMGSDLTPKRFFLTRCEKRFKNLDFLGEIFQTQTKGDWPDPTRIRNFWPEH